MASSQSRIFLISLVFICVKPPGQTKKDTDLKFSTHTTISKNEFFVFSKKSPWRPLTSKNWRVPWIFGISPRLPCFIYFCLLNMTGNDWFENFWLVSDIVLISLAVEICIFHIKSFTANLVSLALPYPYQQRSKKSHWKFSGMFVLGIRTMFDLGLL